VDKIEMSQLEAAPLPPGDLLVVLPKDVRVLESGRLLVGGSPFRALRMTDAGGDVLAGWRLRGPVGESLARRSLARRLLEYDMLCPHPQPLATVDSLTAVVPVRDRVEQLARCLTSVRTSCPEAEIIVIDDGSRDRDRTRAVCDRSGVKLIRHEHPQGAAAARNTGLRACSTRFVAFIDSDVVMPPLWGHRLLAYFADPSVGAVAPRVRSLLPSHGAIAGYEERHSALDMGARPGSVGPGRHVPYLPSATLIVRRRAAAGGFDPSFSIGEDIDFVWRLVAEGWRVCYAPDVHVSHDHRDTLRSFLSRRRIYATSVAMLARRHPRTVPPVRLSTEMAIPWGLVLLGCPRAMLATVLGEVILAGRRLGDVTDHPYRLACTLVVRGLLGTGEGLAYATRRAWSPALIAIALRRPKVWALLAAAFMAPVLRDALATRDPQLVPQDAALRLIDEIVALGGTWEGCLRERVIEPLLPLWHAPGSR
jgi:mycofactocin glycosyltransferase